MGQKAAGLKGPKQVIELFGMVLGLDVDIDPLAAAKGDIRQTAAEVLAAAGGIVGQYVEINAGHVFLSSLLWCCSVAQSIRYWVSKGTGRPVEPLRSPPSQAVPAMSKCAQWNFLVKRARKQAAVSPTVLPVSWDKDRSRGQIW